MPNEQQSIFIDLTPEYKQNLRKLPTLYPLRVSVGF